MEHTCLPNSKAPITTQVLTVQIYDLEMDELESVYFRRVHNKLQCLLNFRSSLRHIILCLHLIMISLFGLLILTILLRNADHIVF